MQFAQKDYILAPQASTRVSWLETLLLTLLALGLGWWFVPQDPLLAAAEFPWMILAPLLLGVRYGFLQGLCSAVLLIAALFAFRFAGLPAYQVVPAAFLVGLLLCTLLVGEFRDIWGRRLERLSLANDYRQLRLDEFTRAHHLLRISHDRLEQRVAGSDQSLRSSLLDLRERLRGLAREEGDALVCLADTILTLLASHASLRIAGLYRVIDGQRVDTRPLAVLGEMPELDDDDLLVRLCLERGELVSVRAELLDRGDGAQHSSLQACVPLVDTEGRILAILAIQQMPFFMFHERTFSLLALLAGHVADLLMSDPRALQLADADAQRYSQLLRRSLLDARDHDLPASLFGLELSDPQHAEELQRLLEDSQRGLDVQLKVRNGRGNRLLLVLLPLTSADGAQGYLRRLRELFTERFGQDLAPEMLGMRIHRFHLEGGDEREALRHFLFNECALNDQQVAI
ncbi:PelD GGDEF domain-containing protein [Zestomonas thermotolerans]|uniref:PelD GGDEF domain-containing protein n=1 Tax=Zestomonas thermotolerans TaxID=157784 RepID=UPI000482CF4B|nr:PelD GGDEF domain-containing protein [Pseudomonas thermotolerans]